MRVLGWLDAFRAVKLAFSIPVKKHPYVCSLSSVVTGVVARLWVGL